MQKVDTGDIVVSAQNPHHNHQIVAYVRGDAIAIIGADGEGKVSDWTLVRKATPEERHGALVHMADDRHGEQKRYAMEVLAKAVATKVSPDTPQQSFEQALDAVTPAEKTVALIPGHWDQHALELARKAFDESSKRPNDKGVIIASIQCAIIDGMRYAKGEPTYRLPDLTGVFARGGRCAAAE